MPTIDEELVANSKAKFNADVNVKDFSNVKTEDGTTLTDYIDEHGGGSVPKNMVTTDTEQTITGKKIFYNEGITIKSNTNNSNVSFCMIPGDTSNAPSFYLIGKDSNNNVREILYFPREGSILATIDQINKVYYMKFTKGDTNIFTFTFTNVPKLTCMTVFAYFVISSVTYTFSFTLTKNSSTCFNVAYGTTSDDVAICRASFISDKLTIDLDNVNATISKISAYYITYTDN